MPAPVRAAEPGANLQLSGAVSAFWDLGDRSNRLNDAHESIVGRAMLAEVPFTGLSFVCGTFDRS